MSRSQLTAGRKPRGHARAIRADGIILVRRRGFGVTEYLIGATVLLGLLTLFKAGILASYGAQGYEDRIGSLADGTLAEGVASLLLGADPATRWIASVIAPAFG